jgi:transposase-like protein
MVKPIIHFPESYYDEVDISCPNCNSVNVTIKLSAQGCFEVSECRDCRYKLSNSI